MARGVNKTILIGNLGADPEFRVTPNDVQVAHLRIATTETWKDRNSGERQERTEWHRVVLFNELAELANDYLEKGKQVYIEGKLQTRKWQDQQGNDRYTTEVVGKDLQMLGGGNGNGRSNASGSASQGRGQGGGTRQRGSQSGGASRGQGRRSQPQQEAPPEPAMAGGGPGVDDFDDDIPF